MTSQMLDLQSKVSFLLFDKLCYLASIKQKFYLVIGGSEFRSSCNYKQQEQYTYVYLCSFISLTGDIVHFLPATHKIIISLVPSKLKSTDQTFKSVHSANISLCVFVVGSSGVESIDVQEQT